MMMILVKNIRGAQKNLPATNAVVYYFPPTATERKSFITLPPGDSIADNKNYTTPS